MRNKHFLVFTLSLFFTLLSIGSAFAQSSKLAVVCLLCPTSASAINLGNPPGAAGPGATASTIITFVFNLLMIIALVVAIGFLLWGGIKWITSGGDKVAVEAARQTVIGAIIGLVVVVMTWVIINVVLSLLGLPSLGVINLPTLRPTPTP